MRDAAGGNGMRIAVFVLCAAAAGGSAVVAQPARQITIDNGLRVILRPVGGLPLVSVWSFIHAGSANECPGITGAAHWCEHMNFRGTSKYSRDEMKGLIEKAGGDWNGYTWLDQTAFHETLPSEALDLALDIEAQRLESSRFDPAAVKAERNVVLSELRMGENDPENLLDISTTAAAMKAHPYRWPTIGWKSDVEGMSRWDLYSFYRRYYGPNNATIVVAGDFDEASVLRSIREKFGGMKSGPSVGRLRTVEPEQLGERRIRLEKGGETPYLLLAYHAPAFDADDFFPLLVLDAILGGGESINLSRVDWRGQASRSSRLYKGLVDAGIAAKAGSLYLPTKYPFLFYVYATAAPGTALGDLEKRTVAIVDGLATGGIGEAEFSKAITQLRARFVYDSDSVTEKAQLLGFFDTIGDYRFPDAYLAKLGRVKREDLPSVARKYFDGKNRTVGWFVPTGSGPSPERSTGKTGTAHYRGKGRSEAGDGLRRLFPWMRGGTSRAGASGGKAFNTRWSKVSVRVPSRIALGATRAVLPNGLTLIVRENHLSPSIAARIDISAGSAYDPPSLPGLANFTARMLDRGSADMSADLIAEVLDSTGTELSISCGRDRATVTIRMLAEKLPTVMEILSQMLASPVFPPAEMEGVRGRISVAIREALNDTRRVAVDGLFGLVYPEGHPYRHRVEGDIESVAAIRREDVVGFYRRYYGPSAVTVVLSGDVDPARARDLAQRYLGGWETGRLADGPTILTPTLPARPKLSTVTLKDKTQEDIALGFRGIERTNPDYYALEVMNTILGRFGMGGRLGRLIREDRGMAYYVFSSFITFRHTGPFVVRAGVKPGNVTEAVEGMCDVMRRLMKEGVTEEELQESKEFIIRSLPRKLETNEKVAAALADIQFYGLGLDYYERLPDLIGAVGRRDILRVAKKYLHPDRFALSLAGPMTEAGE